ncbi:MAG: hypothetical protein AAFV53_42170 [Myxococcota bacterium]
MSVRAWMLGDGGDAPFAGHFRLRIEGTRARLDVAGRLSVQRGPVSAFLPARRLEKQLRSIAPRDCGRSALLHAAWAALAAVPSTDLGPDQGADLSLLLFARDLDGTSIAGVGLVAVWGRFSASWESLARGDHPLLGPAGRPERTPGALNMEETPTVVLACPVGLEPILPSLDQVQGRAGVRR